MNSNDKALEKEEDHKRFSKIANEKYTIVNKIGQGSFGEVFVCMFMKNEKQNFRSVKMEDEKSRTPQLINEAKLLKYLNSRNNTQGYPQMFEYGNESGWNYMVTELLGPPLSDLLTICGNKFSLKTTLMIGMQIIDRLEELHNKHYLFRDIKPENFLMGLHENSHIVYIIDFGLSKKYRDPRTLIHIPYKQDKNITGTIRYTSLNSHLGIEQSRRDDLEALAYMLIYFVKGSLPWQGIKGNSKKEKQYKIMEKKMMIPSEALTKGLPIEFSNFLNYVKTLRFEEKPDYQYLKNELREMFCEEGFLEDWEYDWCCLSESPKEIENSLIKIRITNRGQESVEPGSNKDKGSLTKEPGVLPFKDATFDLSKREWVKANKNGTKTDSSQDEYIEKSELKKTVEKPYAPISSSKEADESFSQEDYKTDKSRFNRKRNDPPKYYKEEESDYNEGKKGQWKEQKSQRYRKDSRFLSRLIQVKQARNGDVVSFQAYVSNGEELKRQTKSGQKNFFECDLTDDSGTLYGSLYLRSRVQNGKYYDFNDLLLKISDGNFRIMEIVDSRIKPNDNLSFKKVFNIIKP